MNRRPAAYVRKSKRLEESAAAQLEAIRTIARRDGVRPDELEVYSDVGRSGRFGQRGAGSDWQRLQDDIEADHVGTLYVTVTDRAGRSMEEWARFTRILREHGVRMVSQDGEVDLSPGLSRATLDMLIAEAEGVKAVERALRAKATRDARGDVTTASQAPYGYRLARAGDVGQVAPERPDPQRVVLVPNPDEPLEPILDAVRETRGNIARAAKLLNERNIPTRSGRPWDPRTLGRIVDREARGLRGRRGPRGVRIPAGRHPLSRLVVCHCGQVMTPNAARNEVICAVGHKVGREQHGRWSARERRILEYLRQQTADLRGTVGERVYAVDEASKHRGELDAEKRRLGIALADDAIDEAEYRRRMDRIKADLAKLGEADDDYRLTVVMKGRLVKWDLLETDPVAFGDQLRDVVRQVRLDEAMQPVGIRLRL